MNYLVSIPHVRPLIATPDRLLRRTPEEMAIAAARHSDVGVTAALRGEYDPRKTYGPLKDDIGIEDEGEFDNDDENYDSDEYEGGNNENMAGTRQQYS